MPHRPDAPPRCLDRRNLLVGVAAATLPFGAPVRAAADATLSDWVSSDHARVRLIDAGRDGTARLAGLQIELDPGYLTYWRTPGEAGVAPVADFAGSTNLASAQLAFPPPARFDEGGAEAFGYKDGIVFPVHAWPADPTRPVTLALRLSFALCETLCLPARADVGLVLAGEAAGPEAGLVRDALASVPAPRRLGQEGALAVAAVAPGSTPDTLAVRVRAPGAPALFVEAPDPWYFQVSSATPEGDGRWRFDVKAVAGVKGPNRVPVRLTLVTAEGAIEVATDLDATATTP